MNHLSALIEVGLAVAVLGLVGVVLLARRASAATVKDLGAVSGQWIAEQRANQSEQSGR